MGWAGDGVTVCGVGIGNWVWGKIAVLELLSNCGHN